MRVLDIGYFIMITTMALLTVAAWKRRDRSVDYATISKTWILDNPLGTFLGFLGLSTVQFGAYISFFGLDLISYVDSQAILRLHTIYIFTFVVTFAVVRVFFTSIIESYFPENSRKRLSNPIVGPIVVAIFLSFLVYIGFYYGIGLAVLAVCLLANICRSNSKFTKSYFMSMIGALAFASGLLRGVYVSDTRPPVTVHILQSQSMSARIIFEPVNGIVVLNEMHHIVFIPMDKIVYIENSSDGWNSLSRENGVSLFTLLRVVLSETIKRLTN